MSETSLTTASVRDYKISPDHFRKIQEHLEANPDRFNDTREFVFRAIDIFLAWETDPLTGKKKMNEMLPTIPQLAMMKVSAKPEVIEQMFPGLLEKHEKEVEGFLKLHPEYTANAQQAISAEEAQEQERLSKNDLVKLIADMHEAAKFVRDIDFKKIKPREDEEEIYYDGWPLLWTHYSRILPAKVALMAIGDIMLKQKEPVITLDDKNAAHIYDVAEELSAKLREYESTEKIKRSAKLSTGLPKPAPSEMTKSQRGKQALVEKRYKDRFIGKQGKNRISGEKVFDGMLSALGLVRVFVKNKEVSMTFTEMGKKFYLRNNPIIHEAPKLPLSSSFSPEERELLLTKILPERKLEMELIRTAVKVIHATDEKFMGKMSENLDAAFYETVKKFVGNNADHPFAKKIEDEIVNPTDKITEENKTLDKKDRKQTPIEAFRMATMGRLSEIGLIRWEIEGDMPGHAASNYYSADKEMMSTLL